MTSDINAMTTLFTSSDSRPNLMPKSGSVSGDFVWLNQVALSMLIDLQPTLES